MPTTSPETATRPNSAHAEGDALDEAYRSFAHSEVAAEQAISETVHALSELVWAVVPSVVLQPMRTLDLALQLGEQALQLQRRLLQELVVNLQVPMMRALTEAPFEENGNGNGVRASSSGGRSNRRAPART